MLETPLSLVTYFSNLQNQMVLVTHKRIWKKFFGARPWRLKPVYGSTELRTLVWLQRAGEQSFEKYLRIPQTYFFCFKMFSEVRKFYVTRDATVLHKLPYSKYLTDPGRVVRWSVQGIWRWLIWDWILYGKLFGIPLKYFLDTFWILFGNFWDT